MKKFLNYLYIIFINFEMSIKKNTEKYVVISCILVLDMLNFTLTSNLFVQLCPK